MTCHLRCIFRWRSPSKCFEDWSLIIEAFPDPFLGHLVVLSGNLQLLELHCLTLHRDCIENGLANWKYGVRVQFSNFGTNFCRPHSVLTFIQTRSRVILQAPVGSTSSTSSTRSTCLFQPVLTAQGYPSHLQCITGGAKGSILADTKIYFDGFQWRAAPNNNQDIPGTCPTSLLYFGT